MKNKEYMLKNFDKYGIMISDSWKFDPSTARPITKAEFIGLLNILEAHGESLDSFHDASFNSYSSFCDIFGSFQDDSDTYHALMQFNAFYTEEEFISWMIEHVQDEVDNYGDYNEAMDHIKKVAFDKECDESIVKTSDGYVRIVRY